MCAAAGIYGSFGKAEGAARVTGSCGRASAPGELRELVMAPGRGSSAPAGPRVVATGGAESAERRTERNPWKRVVLLTLPRRGRGSLMAQPHVKR